MCCRRSLEDIPDVVHEFVDVDGEVPGVGSDHGEPRLVEEDEAGEVHRGDLFERGDDGVLFAGQCL
jgi:hypothetical protein